MLVHRIFYKPRIKNRNARSRRFLSGPCLRLEALENRTPLSSGLVVGIEAVVASRAVETGSVIPGQPQRLEWTMVEVTSVDQAISTVSSETGFTNLTPSQRHSTTSPSLPALETNLSNAPVGTMLSTTSSSAVSDWIATPDLRGALTQPAVGGAKAELPPNEVLSIAGNVKQRPVNVTSIIGDVEIDGDLSFFPLRPGPFMTMGPAAAHGSSQTNSNDDQETDMSYAGSLESIEMDDVFSTWTAAPPATGRASGHALSYIVTDPSLQFDARSEGPTISGLSYLATGGGSTLYTPTSAGDDVHTSDESSSEPISPALIIGGGVSLNVLLIGPDMSVNTEPGGVEQVAELVPLPQSSLALAATLWSVPSDFPTASGRWDASSAGKADDADARQAPASSWVLFVTGMDQALEQTSRDIRDGILSHDGRQSANEGPPGGPDELIDWQGPILPAGQGGLPEPKSKLPRTDPGATFGEAGQGTVRTQRNARPHSDDGQPVVLGAMPMISAVSISTLIAGWFWRKRQRGRRLGLGGRGSTDRSTDGATTT
jgi:hypothetical protein